MRSILLAIAVAAAFGLASCDDGKQKAATEKASTEKAAKAIDEKAEAVKAAKNLHESRPRREKLNLLTV